MPDAPSHLARARGPSPREGRRRVVVTVVATLLVLLAVAFFFRCRATRPIVGLGNHDVAGIAYNADLILRGGLPYVDSVELKSPGSFFVVAAAFALFGRSAGTLLGAATGMIALASLGVGFAAAALYRDEGELGWRWSVGLSVALVWLGMAHFQANYATWMMTPYAWSVACALWALRQDAPRRALAWHAAAGAFAALAFLMKAHAVVLGLCVPLLWVAARAQGRPGAVAGAWWAWIAGALVGVLPLLGLYAAAGELATLVDGVLPLAKAARYADRQAEFVWWKVPWRLGLQLRGLFPVHIALLGLSVAGVVVDALVRRWRVGGERVSGPGPAWIPLALAAMWLVLSLVGGGLGGMRYFRHYAPQYLPALALLAAHPAGVRLLWPWGGARFDADATGQGAAAPIPAAGGGRALPWVGLALGSVALLVVVGSASDYVGRGLRGELSHGWRPRPDEQKLGAFIAEHSAPEDTIFVWGWRGWGVYFFADRHAPTPLYKGLGTITEFNRNGLFQPPASRRDRELDFVPGPHADALLEAFERRPPAFLVRARPFFPGIRNDPMTQFEALYAIWSRDYVQVQRSGRLRLYEHRAHRHARHHEPLGATGAGAPRATAGPGSLPATRGRLDQAADPLR